MELKDIIKEERREVDIEKIEMPEQETTENDKKETTEKIIEEIPVAQLATMAIGAYNVLSCAIYRKIEPGFDASLTTDEVAALQQPTEQFLQQYNIKMTPTVALIIAVVGVNMLKIMQLKAYRATKLQKAKEQQNIFAGYGETSQTTEENKKENENEEK